MKLGVFGMGNYFHAKFLVCEGVFIIIKKTQYLYEQSFGCRLFLFHLLTFEYIILNKHDTLYWKSNDFTSLKNAKALYDKFFLVEDDMLLLNLALNKLSKGGGLNPNHVIFVTDECNQRCTYCFERKKHSLNNIKRTLSFSDIEKIYFMITKLNTKKDNRSHITLFGGEPLLAMSC